MQGQGKSQQEQSDQQSQHGADAEVEAGVDQAEHQRLNQQGGCRTHPLVEFPPQPGPKDQFFGQSHTQAQQKGIDDSVQ